MSISLIQTIEDYLKKLVHELFPSLNECTIEIAKAKDQSFGDYQINSAMKLARLVDLQPRIFATKVVEALMANEEGKILFSKAEVAGPGFINLFINPDFYIRTLKAPLLSKTEKPERVVIDFSSPNIAKEMHVGHLRSTIIGDSLARIFEEIGHDVLRLNHVGDWGTAFGMLIHFITSLPNFSDEELGHYTLQDLMRFYKESKVAFDHDASFRKSAQEEVVKLQSGNLRSLAIWNTICEISERAYQEIYDLLDVTISVRGESFYNPMLPKIVQEFESKNLVTVSDGAKCVYLSGFLNREGEKLPLMIQKSDGGYNYDTTDLAAIAQRIREEKATRIIYVTDSGQATHFQMVFEASILANILDKSKVRVDHVPFGLVLGPDGKKFKTRSGETEKLIDLIQNAILQAGKIMDERHPEWSEKERSEISKILGISAIKYADLSSHRTSDYVFSYERMLRFEGNTAAFIMYSYVRTESIKKKVAKPVSLDALELHHPSEIALAKVLCQFRETIEEVTDSLLPHRLCEYLYTLSNQFNIFFRDCRVEGDPQEASRLAMVSLTGATLKKGMELLGIKVPDRM